ncbi:hypothetical protein CONCODRAFT_2560 [Conidiobolus coronatus NRRL 28638]|uniref:Uncharacterized protein n=1 Tax=Conidiobolus coronatus (strain ATCC 28846 / CBS 209.66 / NRRL 28638) TaxID=796925 RepID=A0A137PH75_CONC2|nr:hypothetical protein CONCODRAFT_2560 [Conidiobolus coronatus NRRL 28638]|eukprot:KXN74356.1 hypothetical protein CONCODRAFT_2560 [Conidiobolus coronatus NRRL 28638]
MEEGTILGTIMWVKNYNEILEKFNDRNIKRISKAIVCPQITKVVSWGEDLVCLDEKFIISMDIYYPDIVFKYNIDTYMSNICIDVYNKLAESGLNGLVDKYIPSYKQCDGYEEKSVEFNFSEKLCECGRIRAVC